MSYIEQFYNEGLATTFYLKPVRFIRKKVRNKKVSNFICMIIKILYTILAIAFGIFMFITRLP